MHLPALVALLLGVCILAISGCRSQRGSSTGDQVGHYVRLWQSEREDEQLEAIRWFARQYMHCGMPRSEIDGLLGLPGGGYPVDRYLPPHNHERRNFGIGVVYYPAKGGDVVDTVSLLPDVPLRPGERQECCRAIPYREYE